MSDVIVVGSLNMDTVVRVEKLPKPGETIHGLNMKKFPGGKGANQATALARLGDRVKFVGIVGNDEDGRLLRSHLQEDGIDVCSLSFSGTSPTGSAIIIVDNEGNNEIIVLKGSNNDVDRKYIDCQENLFLNEKFLLMQFEIPLDTVAYLIGLAHANQTEVVINPSPYYPVDLALLEKIDYLVLNEQEAGLLIDQKILSVEDALKAVSSIHKLGVKNAILTLGELGAVICDHNGLTEHLPAFQVQPIDTTAAGDAFLGGLLHSLLTGNNLKSSVEYANAVGALAASTMGAQSSLPRIGEVDEFISTQNNRKNFS